MSDFTRPPEPSNTPPNTNIVDADQLNALFNALYAQLGHDGVPGLLDAFNITPATLQTQLLAGVVVGPQSVGANGKLYVAGGASSTVSFVVQRAGVVRLELDAHCHYGGSGGGGFTPKYSLDGAAAADFQGGFFAATGGDEVGVHTFVETASLLAGTHTLKVWLENSNNPTSIDLHGVGRYSVKMK